MGHSSLVEILLWENDVQAAWQEAQAADLLGRVESLMNRLGEQAVFQQYLTTVRSEYKRKRNFMKLLDQLS